MTTSAAPRARDLEDYVLQYDRLPFEDVQARVRRRHVLARVAEHAPRRLLEVGCGTAPLFTDLGDGQVTVVEPARVFADRARRMAAARPGTTVVEALLEDVDVAQTGGPFDLVVVSCLLHEVPDPDRLLAAARRLCAPDGRLHVNVPNASSLHRQLAVAMGLISSPAAESATQRTMQQRTVYDRHGLEAAVTAAGFRVLQRGSLLVKPFTHAQMQRLIDDGFLTEQLLDGFDALAAVLPDLGSEIWVDAELADA